MSAPDPIVYSVIEHNDLQSTNYAVSHELYETYTDPIAVKGSDGAWYGFGWWDESVDAFTLNSGAAEIADMCVNGAPSSLVRDDADQARIGHNSTGDYSPSGAIRAGAVGAAVRQYPDRRLYNRSPGCAFIGMAMVSKTAALAGWACWAAAICGVEAAGCRAREHPTPAAVSPGQRAEPPRGRPALEPWQGARLQYLLEAGALLKRQWPALAAELPCVVLVTEDEQWRVGCADQAEPGFEPVPQRLGDRTLALRVSKQLTIGRHTVQTRDWLRSEVATAYVAPPAQADGRAPGRGTVWVAALETMIALREDFRQCTTDEWLSVALHELFHVWQLRSPAFGAELRAIDDGTLSPAAVRGLYLRDARYRALVRSEYRLLVDAASAGPGRARARRALRRWRARYRRRRDYLMALPGGSQYVHADRVFTGLEGLARYVESRFLVDAALHPAHGIEGDLSFHRFARYAGGGYEAMQNRQLDPAYDYAIGFHLALLLDRVEPGWQANVVAASGLLDLAETLAEPARDRPTGR